MKYIDKLREFNRTEKYQSEIDFMVRLMKIKRNQKVLDYGCGTGWMCAQMIHQTGCDIIGYDINIGDYMDDIMFPKKFCNTLPDMVFDHIYMMHSLAHIQEIGKALVDLKNYMHEKTIVYILTPNALWLEQMIKNEYKPDTTVIQHYTPNGLRSVFESYDYKIVHQGEMGTDINGYHERLFIACTK